MFTNDFDTNRDIRILRVSHGQPVIAKAHGKYWFLAYRYYYVFLGEELVRKVLWKLSDRNKNKLYGSTTGYLVSLVQIPSQDPSTLFNYYVAFYNKPSRTIKLGDAPPI